MAPLLRFSIGAATALAVASSPTTAAAQSPARPVLIVDIAEGQPELDADTVRKAIGEELGDDAVADEDPRAENAVGSLSVTIDRPKHALVVGYEGANGSIERRVELPKGRDAVGRAAVMLAGNLARNEADELAALLHHAKDPPRPADPRADDRKELDRLGIVLEAASADAHGRAVASGTLQALAWVSFAAGIGLGTASMVSFTHDQDAAAMVYGTTGSYVAASALFSASSVLRAGNLDEVVALYEQERARESPSVVRLRVEQAWKSVADEERTRRRSGALLGMIFGGLGVSLVGGIATAGLASEMQHFDLGSWNRASWQAAAVTVGSWVVFSTVTTTAIVTFATPGPTERALHAYEHDAGHTVVSMGQDASFRLRPLVLPVRGGAMTGFGGVF